MPITVSQKNYARAVGVHGDTVCRRLRDVHYTGGERSRRYHLAGVLPTLTARERAGGAVQRLFDTATTDDTLFVGDDVIAVCRDFENWLDPDQTQRLAFCQILFTAGLYNSTVSSEIWQFIDSLQKRLCLDSAICRYIVTGTGRLPIFDHFSLAFALSNAQHFEPNMSSNKEAA